jgi:hypothetical protein
VNARPDLFVALVVLIGGAAGCGARTDLRRWDAAPAASPERDASRGPDASRRPDASPPPDRMDARPPCGDLLTDSPMTTTSWEYCIGPCESLWYDGETHVATYRIDADPASFDEVHWVARASLDDHYVVPLPYCLHVRVNDGPPMTIETPPLEHGTPYGRVFDNFREIAIPLPRASLRSGSNTVAMELGCSRAREDWIVIERSFLRLRRDC